MAIIGHDLRYNFEDRYRFTVVVNASSVFTRYSLSITNICVGTAENKSRHCTHNCIPNVAIIKHYKDIDN